MISLAEGEDAQTSTGGYAALDNIALHPCVDCSAPGRKFSISYNIGYPSNNFIYLQSVPSQRVFLVAITLCLMRAVLTAPTDISMLILMYMNGVNDLWCSFGCCQHTYEWKGLKCSSTVRLLLTQT